MRDLFRKRRMWRPHAGAAGPLRRRHHRRRLARPRDSPTTSPATTGSPTSACSSRATSAPAPPGATRRSCAPTTRRPRAPASTTPRCKLYEGLSAELGFNLLFSQQGHLTLAHTDRAMFVMTERAEVNQLGGIDSQGDRPGGDRAAGAGDVARARRRLSGDGRPLSPARRDHPPRRGGLGAGARRRRGRRRDPPVHRGHRDRALQRARDRGGPRATAAGSSAGHVVSATAGWSSTVAAMAGVELPITTHILQAFVTEPLKPLLDVVVVSSQMHVYISQTDRGEFLIGAEIEPWTTYRQQGTLNFLQESLAPHARALPAAGARADPAELGRALRHQPGLQPDPRASPRSTASCSAPAGAPTASRRRRSSARRWPS